MSAGNEIFLMNYVRELGVSEPVFTVTLQDGCLQLLPKNEWVAPTSDDSVARVAAYCHAEYLDRERGRFILRTTEDDMMRFMLRRIRNMYKAYSTLKSPRSSKVYRWLASLNSRDLPASAPVTQGLIQLYKYANANFYTAGADTPNDNMLDASCVSKVHTNNFLLILEKMKDKYAR